MQRFEYVEFEFEYKVRDDEGAVVVVGELADFLRSAKYRDR